MAHGRSTRARYEGFPSHLPVFQGSWDGFSSPPGFRWGTRSFAFHSRPCQGTTAAGSQLLGNVASTLAWALSSGLFCFGVICGTRDRCLFCSNFCCLCKWETECKSESFLCLTNPCPLLTHGHTHSLQPRAPTRTGLSGCNRDHVAWETGNVSCLPLYRESLPPAGLIDAQSVKWL